MKKTFKIFAPILFIAMNAHGTEKLAITTGRAPASVYTTNEELIPVPAERESWLADIMVEDDAGVMRGVREQLNFWNEREEYARVWNLEDSGVVEVAEEGEKQKLIQKNILKYIDKRISGEIKNADEGSTFHTVGQVQTALKPESEVGVSENFKLKFKARVLQQKATMFIVNPFVDSSAEVRFNGKMKVDVKRSFASVGVDTSMEYHVNSGELNATCQKNLEAIGVNASLNYRGLENQYIAALDKPLAPNLVGRVSSAQPMGGDAIADNKVELLYSSSF